MKLTDDQKKAIAAYYAAAYIDSPAPRVQSDSGCARPIKRTDGETCADHWTYVSGPDDAQAAPTLLERGPSTVASAKAREPWVDSLPYDWWLPDA